MKLLSSIVLVLASVTALADIPRPNRPVVEPGPIQAIKDNAVNAMDAMLSAKAADMKKFMAAGNSLTAATSQALSPDTMSYTFTRQQCMVGGIVGTKCLGGAQLQVTVQNKRMGSGVQKIVTSSVNLIR